jgi:hypothetical protein
MIITVDTMLCNRKISVSFIVCWYISRLIVDTIDHKLLCDGASLSIFIH